MKTEILDCGHAPTETDSKISNGIARDAAGNTMCYKCAADRLKADALADKVFVAYVSTDGKWITTWDGQRIGTVHRRTVSGFKAYYRVTAYGKIWYGQGPSESGTYVTLRQYKNQD